MAIKTKSTSTKKAPLNAKCFTCGKRLGGKKFIKIGNMYCCEECCGKGKKNNACEFC